VLPPKKLVVAGFYRYVRNPMYLGFIVEMFVARFDGSGANAGKHASGGRHGFHLLVPLEICKCQVPRDRSN
jgi:protein-S-isoprenylcysteine O-methyltransferase Ste14